LTLEKGKLALKRVKESSLVGHNQDLLAYLNRLALKPRISHPKDGLQGPPGQVVRTPIECPL